MSQMILPLRLVFDDLFTKTFDVKKSSRFLTNVQVITTCMCVHVMYVCTCTHVFMCVCDYVCTSEVLISFEAWAKLAQQ